jgi:mono/diheme cytochrome c family protein
MQRLLLRLILSVLTLAAPGISTAADGNAKAKALYSNTCIACHGANGKGAIPGVPDLGPRMTMTDDDLTNSILNGLQSKGSLMAMPPGGLSANGAACERSPGTGTIGDHAAGNRPGTDLCPPTDNRRSVNPGG